MNLFNTKKIVDLDHCLNELEKFGRIISTLTKEFERAKA